MYYPIPLAVGMFLAIAGLLMLAFFMYQAYMISQGHTTYETYKRNLLYKQMAAAAGAQQAARAGSIFSERHCRVASTSSVSSSGWLAKLGLHRRWQQPAPHVKLPPNRYDKGFWGNWYEVLFPEQFLQQWQQRQAQQKRKAPAADSTHGGKKQR